MEHIMIIRAGIRKHKGSFYGIAALLFFVSLSLSTVLIIYLGGEDYIRKEMERIGFGNLTAWVSNVPDIEVLTKSIQMQEGIENTKVQNLLFSEYEANGIESDSEGQLISWIASEENYRFFQEDFSGYQAPPKEIVSGTIYVSASMVSIMNLKIGDIITFPIARNGKNISFTVAGYYEDPFMGTSMIGMKGFLISESDYKTILQIVEETGIDSLARNGAMIHIFINSESNLSASDINRLLNENTSLSQYTEFVYSAKAIEGFMLILQNAFCGLLTAFAFVLLETALIILGHSILGIIELEYKNLGILKTIGFTGNRLICLQLMQYMTAIGIGLLSGGLAAFFTAGFVSKMILTTTGVLLPTNLPLLPCLVMYIIIFLLLVSFTMLKLRKITSITPMEAIRKETSEIKWKRRAVFEVRAKGLSFQLAIRQILSGKKRYLSACLIAALLVFFASLTGRMNAWLGSEGKGMMDAFNPADLDIGVQTLGKLESAKVEKMVRSYTEIIDSYLLAMPSISVNGTNYTANVITEPERFHISRGKTSMKEDEIVLTEIAASDLGVSIGDNVTVRGNIRDRKFTVSGIYHCANDMGANIGMSREGYLTIAQDDPHLWCHHYFLADSSQKKAIIDALESAYGGDVHVHENSWPGLFGIISAMQGLLIVMYGMIAIFILIVTVMTGNRILTAEQKDLGIYKSIGCSAKMLRITFSLQFGIVAVIGSMAGTILALLLTDSLVSSVMRFAGISNFASHPTILNILTPGIVVILLFFGFSYLAAGRIKKEDLTVLTAE